MIDIRDISYTQGSPLNPVEKGVLLKTKPTGRDINVPKGTVVSRAQDKSIKQLDTGAIATDVLISSLGLTGLAWNTYRGLTNPGAMTPSQFGATQTAGLMGVGGWIASLGGILKAQESGVQGVAPPGVNIFPPAVTTIIEGGGGGSIFNFPDLSGLKKYAIPLLIGIAGLYIVGKVISR